MISTQCWAVGLCAYRRLCAESWHIEGNKIKKRESLFDAQQGIRGHNPSKTITNRFGPGVEPRADDANHG